MLIDRVHLEQNTPFWPEGNTHDCKHTPEEYMGSFTTLYGPSVREAKEFKHDVYLRWDNGVCIRHSNEDGDYSGIPSVEYLTGLDGAEFKHALKLILHKRFPYLRARPQAAAGPGENQASNLKQE